MKLLDEKQLFADDEKLIYTLKILKNRIFVTVNLQNRPSFAPMLENLEFVDIPNAQKPSKPIRIKGKVKVLSDKTIKVKKNKAEQVDI